MFSELRIRTPSIGQEWLLRDDLVEAVLDAPQPSAHLRVQLSPVECIGAWHGYHMSVRAALARWRGPLSAKAAAPMADHRLEILIPAPSGAISPSSEPRPSCASYVNAKRKYLLHKGGSVDHKRDSKRQHSCSQTGKDATRLLRLHS